MELKIIAVYLIVINLIGFISMYADKRRSIQHRRRTPEKRLLLYAILGGSLGSMIGMSAFRHKTKHLKFKLGLPLILLAETAAGGIVYRYLSTHMF